MVVSEVRAEAGGLEGVVVQLRPMECLVEVGCGKGVKEVMEKNGVALTEVKKGKWVVVCGEGRFVVVVGVDE